MPLKRWSRQVRDRVFGAIFVALWPALWVDLPGTLARFLADVRLEGETARPNGNFFFGQAVEEDRLCGGLGTQRKERNGGEEINRQAHESFRLH